MEEETFVQFMFLDKKKKTRDLNIWIIIREHAGFYGDESENRYNW